MAQYFEMSGLLPVGYNPVDPRPNAVVKGWAEYVKATYEG